MIYDIETIRAMFNGNAVRFTQHFRNRIKERGIRFSEVKQVIYNGEIIEEKPDDQPIPSVLILGHANGKKIHVVVGIDDDLLWLITTYIPTDEIWEDDYKKRKDIEEWNVYTVKAIWFPAPHLI